MTEQIIMLGTGSAMVTDCYNTCFLLRAGNEYFLVDAGGGNGILSAVKNSHTDWNNIRNMFITHSHTDHIIGAVWVIRQISAMMNENKYSGNFNIYCHDECVNTLKSFCSLTLAPKFLKNIDKRIFINEVKNADELHTENFSFAFFDIFSNKTKQFGFNVSFPSGKTLACLGDEPFNEKCRIFVEDKDYLMCEAFCLYSQKDIFKPYEKFHSTALDAGRLAQSLNVKNLILYHTEDKTLLTRRKTYSDEAATVFNGSITVPDDLQVIEITG